jgi:hypothetical protein
MAKGGNPPSGGLFLGLAYEQCLVGYGFSDVRFGAELPMLPDRDGDGAPELLITGPQDNGTDITWQGQP